MFKKKPFNTFLPYFLPPKTNIYFNILFIYEKDNKGLLNGIVTRINL